ncbi:MAG TPA: hypothetical protein VIY48_06770 [Candidatus Paceibacterota bacterium]
MDTLTIERPAAPTIVPDLTEWPVVDTDGWDSPIGPQRPIPTKLSEAIRIGAMGRSSKMIALWSRDDDNYVCAVGAAYIGVFGAKDYSLSTVDAIALIANALHLDFDSLGEYVLNRLPAKNDSQALSLEELAQWVESKGF